VKERIATLTKETDERLKKELAAAIAVSLSLDLWMSRHVKDTFATVVHFIDDEGNLQSRILDVCEVDSTTGVDLAPKFKKVCETFNLQDKTVAIVKDGGGNLAVMADAISSQVYTLNPKP
jgi:hypothetical protein